MSTPETPPTGGDDPGRGLSGVQRAGVVLGGLAVLLIIFVVLRGNDDNGGSSSSSAPQATATSTGADSTASDPASGSTSTATSTTTSSTGSTSTATTPEPAVQTVRVVNGQPAGGIKTISYTKGDQIRLKVQSDTADEIHVHGYDLKKDVTAGGSVEFDFKATIEGRFEVELENAGTQIAMLEVDPS
jgi:copper(I)-binding protein